MSRKEQRRSARTEDFKEGVQAVFERRRPNFRVISDWYTATASAAIRLIAPAVRSRVITFGCATMAALRGRVLKAQNSERPIRRELYDIDCADQIQHCWQLLTKTSSIYLMSQARRFGTSETVTHRDALVMGAATPRGNSMYRCLPPIHCVFVGVRAIPLAILARDSSGSGPCLRCAALLRTCWVVPRWEPPGMPQYEQFRQYEPPPQFERSQATGSIEVGTAQSVRGYSLRESRGG